MTTFEDMQTQIYVLLLRFSILSGKITFLNIKNSDFLQFVVLFKFRSGRGRTVVNWAGSDKTDFNLEMLR